MSELDKHLWERMPGESAKAFGKFCAYRDLGPGRSLARLRQQHGNEKGWSRAGLEALSQRWRWVARAEAWDEEQDRLRRQAQSEAIREMAERQARDGLDMQKLARTAMRKWLKEDPESGQLTLATTLRPAEAARLYELGFDVERVARGEPTQVTQDLTPTKENFDEQRIAAGIAYALAQARPDATGMGGGGEAVRLPAPEGHESEPVDGSAALDQGQAEPDGPAEAEPDPEEAGD